MSNEQEMQFADPAWQPRVTREFEAVAPAPAPPGLSPSGAAATSSQAGEALFEDYAQGYSGSQIPAHGPDGDSQEQVAPPAGGQGIPPQGQRPPLGGQQPLPGQQQATTSQGFQDMLSRLPKWAWWVIGIVALETVLQPVTDSRGAAGAFFGLLVLALTAFVGWLVWSRRLRVSLHGEAQEAETHTFTVGAQPTIVLKNQAGSIHLHAGQEGQVKVTTTRRGYLFNPSMDRETQIWYNQDSSNNTVTARTEQWRLLGKTTVLFDVEVPPQANIQLTTNMGTIRVENIAGQMTLLSNVGTIEARHITLQGKSQIKSNIGTITLAGTLDPGGNYELVTNIGTVDVTLPGSTSFDLRAGTDMGIVNSDFALPQYKRSKLVGTVGSGPHPRLKLKADIGSVTLHHQ